MKQFTRSRWAVGGALAVSIGLGGVLTLAHAGSGAQPSALVPITPCRLVDTRADQTVGGRNTPLAATEVTDFAVWGTNGNCTIPSTATGIVSNITAVNGTAASYLTVYPGDAGRPLSSNLNWTAGSAPTPNQVTVGLSATGGIKAYNNSGSVDVVIDIVGYYQAESAGSPGQPGQPGQPGSVLDKIPSGKTITGYEAYEWSGLPNSSQDEVVHFPAKAPVALTDATVNFSNTFSALTPENDASCTGSFAAPTAPAGKVCLYLDKDSQAGHVVGASLPVPFGDTGFWVVMGSNTGDNFISMSWAYTAP